MEKVVILAGGYGTRLSEETTLLPKPLLEIGEKPILWHIMKIYSFYGYNDFIILLGYKGYLIKEYFINYFLHQSDVQIDVSSRNYKILNNHSEPWKVTLLDTGKDTMTGGRLLRAKKYLDKDTFMLTYGDGLADVNINNLMKFHKNHRKTLTLTTVQPEGRFGSLNISNNNRIENFYEKPKGDNTWINGGYFVCEPNIFEYLNNEDNTIFEKEPLEKLARNNELYGFKHNGFWKCMDTQREKILLNKLWFDKKAKWKVWE
ncbi:MAG: Glucose-1-phosphate cytidylyltransferase [Candidatus Anoxychlamydiales bacterium]|nr:Glucose-1-phosphate cytidylyltransferase [Candidatus Anoxychlamydiales bacterium]